MSNDQQLYVDVDNACVPLKIAPDVQFHEFQTILSVFCFVIRVID